VVARTLAAEETGTGFAFLGSASRARVRALTDVRYLAIDGDVVDELVGWNQRFAEDFKKDPELLRRMGLIKRIGIFHDLPMENVSETFKRMHQRPVQAGETVVTQGEPGDAYYLIDTGEAEVVRTDPFTDETACVAHLGPGDGFGEESLLQEGLRNATVTMTAPGKLLVLNKSDFDELVRPTFVEEITAEPAGSDRRRPRPMARLSLRHGIRRVPDTRCSADGTGQHPVAGPYARSGRDLHRLLPERAPQQGSRVPAARAQSQGDVPGRRHHGLALRGRGFLGLRPSCSADPGPTITGPDGVAAPMPGGASGRYA